MIVDFAPIIDKCMGCSRTITGPDPGPQKCSIYLFPASKWRYGNCPMATHLKKQIAKVGFVDPLKASRKSMKGKK